MDQDITTTPETTGKTPETTGTVLTAELAEIGNLVPDGPEGYGLTYPDDAVVDKELAEDFCRAAHRMGLNRAQAQELASLYAGYVSDFEARQHESVLKSAAEWADKIRSRPAFDKELGHARRALSSYGSNDLIDVLNQSALGSHPAVFDFMAAVGKALAEPGFRGDGANRAPLTVEKILYPNMK